MLAQVDQVFNLYRCKLMVGLCDEVLAGARACLESDTWPAFFKIKPLIWTACDLRQTSTSMHRICLWCMYVCTVYTCTVSPIYICSIRSVWGCARSFRQWPRSVVWARVRPCRRHRHAGGRVFCGGSRDRPSSCPSHFRRVWVMHKTASEGSAKRGGLSVLSIHVFGRRFCLFFVFLFCDSLIVCKWDFQ